MHVRGDFTDLPNVIPFERRRYPDRRTEWRGGRRATDWLNRPAGAWAQFEGSFAPWRQWLAKFPFGGGSARHHQ